MTIQYFYHELKHKCIYVQLPLYTTYFQSLLFVVFNVREVFPRTLIKHFYSNFLFPLLLIISFNSCGERGVSLHRGSFY